MSDPDLEEFLRVHLDFITFTGFESDIPDETTFCRFRGLLNEKRLWQHLLDKVNRQLQTQNLQIKPAQAAIVDAALHLSADPDARWIKKGKVSTYSYKGFSVVGVEDEAI